MRYTLFNGTKTLFCLLVFFASHSAVVYAAGGILENPIKHRTISELLLSVLNGVTIILMPIMILAIVVVGFSMVKDAATGNAGKWQDHKKSLLISILGLFLVLAAHGIIRVIQNTVNEVLTEPTSSNLIFNHNEDMIL